MMVKRSLFLKVSIKLILLWVLMFCLLILGLGRGIHYFFTLETFSTIENAQSFIGVNTQEMEEILRSQGEAGFLKRSEIQNFRNVRHIILFPKQILNISERTETYLKEAYQNAARQKPDMVRYTYEDKKDKILYVIRKVEADGQEAYLISYMWDVYQRDLTDRLFRDVFKIMIILFIATIVTALFIARSITSPIKQTELTVKAVMNNRRIEPPSVYPDDEIGRLMQSVFVMQDKLRDRERESRAFLQSISHDLKTPVMVIRSYAQAIRDDVLIENSLLKTVDVMDKEALKLEKRIKNLLLLNSMEKLYADKRRFVCIDGEDLFASILERFQMNERGIAIQYVGGLDWVYGDRDGLETAFSNIVENALRYAKSIISIEAVESETGQQIRIQNDGPEIDEGVLENIFEAFYRHKEGHFGLGLYIAQKTLRYHGGTIRAYNQAPWVVFEMTLPKADCQNP